MEEILSVALSRKTKNPELYEKIKSWTEDINSETGLFFDGPEKMEYNMYAWLLVEKNFKITDIRNLAEKEDNLIEGLFKEYHDTLIEHKDELKEYLGNINKKAAERVGKIKFPAQQITNEKDAEKIYKHNFWACKMLKTIDLPDKKDSSLILMDDMLGAATNKDNSILFRAYNYQNFKNYYNSNLIGKAEKDIDKEDVAFKRTRSATIKPNFDPHGHVSEINLRRAESVLGGGADEPVFSSRNALLYKDSVKPLLGNRNAVREMDNSRTIFNECLNGLNTKHRFWFTGKDTGEMDDLKRKTSELINTVPYGRNDKTFGGRYITALYETLKASLNYKVRKDAENKILSDRTYMGQERYKANDKLLKQVISEIKRVEPVMKNLFQRNGKLLDYPEFSFDTSELYGQKQVLDTIAMEDGNKKNFLRNVRSANIVSVLNKDIKSIDQLELALKSDELLKDYAEKDLDNDEAYHNWLNDPHIGNAPKVILENGNVVTKVIVDNNDVNIVNPVQQNNVNKEVNAEKLIEERNEIRELLDVKDKKEKESLSYIKPIIPKWDDETKRRIIEEQKEFEQDVESKRKLVAKLEAEKRIRTKIDDYMSENKLKKSELPPGEYDRIWNRFAGEYKMERQERQKLGSQAGDKLNEAKEIARQNEARRLQQKLDNQPFEVLIDEIEHEMKIRKLNIADVQNITASAMRSLFYNVLMDEYGKNLGMDPKEKNKLGCYSPSKIRDKLKEVSPEVKEHANKELKNA
ncbi:MAG: hypothetical protein IKR27_01075, partial [Lachnospiraceae bacterium]|nr:hypothetical protein [Lachnospiraceae bacterium]